MELPLDKDIPVPMPSDWANIHGYLVEAWRDQNDSLIPKPPVPLILAGAAFSSAGEIRQRWKDLIMWANEHGFATVVSELLTEPPEHDVAEAIAGV